MSSSQAFSSLSCEEVFSFTEIARVERVNPLRKNHRHSTKSYRQFLISLAQFSLGVDNLSPQQVKALETYYDVVRGEVGEDGAFARVGNYTFSQRRRIVRFLREVFSPEQVTTLIEDGVVEIDRSSNAKITMRVLRRLNKGKKIFIQLVNTAGEVLRISKILEEMNSGWLVEANRVNNESGQIVKEQVFLVRGNVYALPLLEAHPSNMTKISEKTNNGFVIDITEKYGTVGNKVFLSFEKAIENGLLPRNPTDQDYHKLEDILNSYISNNFGQLAQALVDMRASFLYEHLNPLLQKSFIIGEPNFRLANPELESVFLAAESTRKRIDSSELNLPPPTNEEAKLVEQGYKANYTEELNQANRWFVIRRRLQELRANPHITHIEYFADQIPHHIAYIKKGLEDNYSPKKASHGSKFEQLQDLGSLEREVKEAISEGRVTYKWWYEFNFRLGEIISGSPMTPLNLNFQSARSALFPVKVMMPIIQESEGLGFMTFNRVGPEGVYPVGLINRQSSAEKVHGGLSAEMFFFHDSEHSKFPGNTLYLEYSAGHRLFHKRLLNNIEELPPERRKKAEAIYFLMTHEYQERNISYSDWTPQQIKGEVARIIDNSSGAGFFKFSDDPIQKKQKINDLADTFMEVYNQTLQHQ